MFGITLRKIVIYSLGDGEQKSFREEFKRMKDLRPLGVKILVLKLSHSSIVKEESETSPKTSFWQ
jgi:hypothetical protein